eukprot:CAMPEP_0174722486 /NCGR_PEP_ID=MMETSP1094-20130205/38579_1 /TAXON_ID=156173 /ORGANISM="Chrysochromulina brevifilum, Strain UTEX LB 985" /LENGTH=133 /DNA_ID=CAMNT_0015923355 /DNA_START=67 /DNA_END=468 /DNA_ORIENTATION=+
MSHVRSVLLMMSLAACVAIDMKWSPNGEAPAPFSTNARKAAGIDPAAFAGQTQAPLTPPGSSLQLTLGALIVVYLTNNWKLVLALQEVLLGMLKPFFKSMEDRKVRSESLSLAQSQAEARKARAARARAKSAE